MSDKMREGERGREGDRERETLLRKVELVLTAAVADYRVRFLCNCLSSPSLLQVSECPMQCYTSIRTSLLI